MLKISKINREIARVNPEMILFDKDGTLIDVHHYWIGMLKLRSELIVNMWFRNHSDKNSIKRDLIESMGGDVLSGKIKVTGPVGIKSRKFLVRVASSVVRSKGISINNSEIEAIFLEVDRVSSEDMKSLVKPLPGVLELLRDLKNVGIAMAIVSTDITSRARLAMESLGIIHFFTEIIGGNEVKNSKPFPDLALQISKKTGVNVDKMMVIGDNPVDIQMGLSANISLNIAVLTGLSDENSFNDLSCMIIKDLESIEVENVKR
jgi:phosphoglycolate phosphatase